MLFDLQNFWLFVLAVAAIYAVIVNFIQNNIGGKGRMKALQKEMTEVQKKMLDAGADTYERVWELPQFDAGGIMLHPERLRDIVDEEESMRSLYIDSL